MSAQSSLHNKAAPHGATRLASIDGIRGAAICMVLLGHLIGFAGLLGKVPLYTVLFQTPLHVIWDETGAVQVFFVLSGFVLQIGMDPSWSPAAAWRFLIVRCFRLYPLYAVGLIFALACRAVWGGHPALAAFNPDLGIFWDRPVSWSDLANHLVPLFPTAQTSNIDAVLWSIFVEFKFSLLFPIVAACVGLAASNRPAFLLSVVGSFVYSWLSPGESGGRFLFHFMFGAAVAQLMPLWIGVTWKWANLLGAGLAVWLLELRYSSYAPHLLQSQFDLLCALSSSLLLVSVVRSPMLGRVFAGRFLVWAGQRTFGIYLFHFPILLLAISWLTPWHGLGRGSIWAIAAIATISISFALAAITHRAIELPANTLGKRIAYGNRPRRAADAGQSDEGVRPARTLEVTKP